MPVFFCYLWGKTYNGLPRLVSHEREWANQKRFFRHDPRQRLPRFVSHEPEKELLQKRFFRHDPRQRLPRFASRTGIGAMRWKKITFELVSFLKNTFISASYFQNQILPPAVIPSGSPYAMQELPPLISKVLEPFCAKIIFVNKSA